MIKKCKSYTLLILLLLIAGCESIVPAKTPPQLQHTPGVPLTITEDRIETDWFTLAYPDSWRVVTNVAVEPVALVFVSPDESLVIQMNTTCDSLSATPDASDYTRSECFDRNQPCPVPLVPVTPFPTPEPCFLDLHFFATVDQNFDTELDAAFERIVNSVVFR